MSQTSTAPYNMLRVHAKGAFLGAGMTPPAHFDLQDNEGSNVILNDGNTLSD
jgi:hypothetical protein